MIREANIRGSHCMYPTAGQKACRPSCAYACRVMPPPTLSSQPLARADRGVGQDLGRPIGGLKAGTWSDRCLLPPCATWPWLSVSPPFFFAGCILEA